LTLQAACVAGKTSHSDVATAIGRTQKGVRRFSSDGNDPSPLRYGAASGRRHFRGRRLGLVGDQLAQERNEHDEHDPDREAAGSKLGGRTGSELTIDSNSQRPSSTFVARCPK
jgi:hypothetical protein